MLPREFRLGTAADFAAVVKAGRRAGTTSLVVHALIADLTHTPRAGFVVSGKVGNSVVRHRITRRLRPLVLDQLRATAPGTSLVVRALPPAASASSAELDADLRIGVAAAVRKAAAAARSSAARPDPAPRSRSASRPRSAREAVARVAGSSRVAGSRARGSARSTTSPSTSPSTNGGPA